MTVGELINLLWRHRRDLDVKMFVERENGDFFENITSAHSSDYGDFIELFVTGSDDATEGQA
ncbi:hypothetical protein [Nocardia terpenica]|uniref:hypothetical protein n=1 Tax=Nocardia terpenica TaxID=455432 RepID=UPI0012FDF225|nr:hypothetical protein [Nocardia terpenica]